MHRQSLITSKYDRNVMMSVKAVIADQRVCAHRRRQDHSRFTTDRVSCQHLSLHKVKIFRRCLCPHVHGLPHCAGEVNALSICWFYNKKVKHNSGKSPISNCDLIADEELQRKQRITIRWSTLCLEPDTADHVTEVCRDALQHFPGCKTSQLVLLQIKEVLQCRVLDTFHLQQQKKISQI